MTRVILFTGKGGVGKTTVAAATAVRAAARGREVLVTSTDPAHSLGDALDMPLGDEPTTVAPRLQAQQIDARTRLERRWNEIRAYLVELLAWGGVGEVEAEELVMLPGLDELFSLLDLRDQVASGRYDLVAVDCAPTAETLRLLALPDAMRWYVDRMLGPGRLVARAVRPVVGRVGGVPVPEDEVFGAVEQVHRELAEVHRVLQDPEVTSVRLVVNPERMVISEALRTATSLSLFGYAIDATIVNRVLPDEVVDPYLSDWKQRQKEHLETIRSSFEPVPVRTAPLLPNEIAGPDGLLELGASLYGDDDETEVMHVQRLITVESTDDGHVLKIALPFASKEDLDLHRRGGDLHVRVGNYKRTVPLPSALQRSKVAGARLRDQSLEVAFIPPTPTPQP
ncbi:MAG: ArsA family ATPase [Nitriliruptorales bacterium]|nr:ArsA family ATPase [Nitriliruptorales bacterium]